jgi:hypothetical protein
MNDFQSIQTTIESPRTTPDALGAPGVPATVVFVGRDSMATSHSSRAWTRKSSHKTPQKTSEGDSTILDTIDRQDTEIEGISAISA